MDVITVFLNSDIDTAIYVEYPPGYKDIPHRGVLRVRKSVYGLKQAPRLWYITLVTHLISTGYTQLIKDRCVFMKVIDGRPVYVGVYVDDLIILAPTPAMMATIKSDLASRFKMHDLGELTFILGIRITRDRSRRTLTMSQSQYASTVLRRFGHSASNPVATPMAPRQKLCDAMRPSSEADRLFMLDKDYRAVVGSLMYLMIGTRPDLAYLVQQLSQFLSDPGPDHWRAAIHGLRYLKGTMTYGLTLGGTHDPTVPLHAYADSDYANCVDTRRCVGGYVALFYNSPVAWVAKKCAVSCSPPRRPNS
jgi:hypothetical protein